MMNTKENNKLIAEFMGAHKQPDYVDADVHEYEMYGIIESIEDGENEKHFFHPEEMRFHSSWDWLMPVVEKIEGTETENGYYEVRPFIDRTEIVDDHFHVFIEADGGDRQKNTYKAVVKFVKWYNEKNKEDAEETRNRVSTSPSEDEV